MFHSIFVGCYQTAKAAGSIYEDAFVNSYREHLSNFDIDAYISASCRISLKTQIAALQTACQTTSELLSHASIQNTTDSTLSHKLLSSSVTMWNPVLSASLQGMISKPPSVSDREPRGTPRTKFSNKQSPLDKTQVNLEVIRDEMIERVRNGDQLFPNINTGCGLPSCSRCLSLFQTLPLTPCMQHGGAKCSQSGWYPHLHFSLWRKIASIHNNLAKRWEWKPPEVRDYQLRNPCTGIIICASSTAEPEEQVTSKAQSASWVEQVEDQISIGALSIDYQPQSPYTYSEPGTSKDQATLEPAPQESSSEEPNRRRKPSPNTRKGTKRGRR